MRSAFQHLARDLDRRLTLIVALLRARAARVHGNTACLDDVRRMLRHVPVGGPFPDVADHVVKAVPVRRKSTHRRGPLVPVPARVLPRELSLPRVCLVTIAWQEFVTPGVRRTVESSSGSKLPF